MIFLSFLMSFFCPHCKAKYRLNFIANLMDNLFAHVFLGGYLFFFGLIILFGLSWEFFKFFLPIGMILIPLRVVFIILVPFHLENSFLGKTFYFLENLFCLAFAILLIVAIIMPFLERISKIFF